MIDLHGFGAQLATGTLVTIELALVALSIGLALGLMGAAAKLSHIRVLCWVSNAYTTVMRGIPELLVVLLIYFASSSVLTALVVPFGYDGFIELSPFVAGSIALGFTFGAYASEVFRGALQAIARGQTEAAYTAMQLLKKAHIGEIQSAIWPGEMVNHCRRSNINLI